MNYDQARQIDPEADRPDAGKWRYTTMNDGHVRTIGYCSGYRECPECHGSSMFFGSALIATCTRCFGKGFTMQEDCPGHDTREEAERHYYEWRADHLVEREYDLPRGMEIGSRYACEAMTPDMVGLSDIESVPQTLSPCGAGTWMALGVSGEMGSDAMLCDEHRNRDGWMSARPFVAGMTSIHS